MTAIDSGSADPGRRATRPRRSGACAGHRIGGGSVTAEHVGEGTRRIGSHVDVVKSARSCEAIQIAAATWCLVSDFRDPAEIRRPLTRRRGRGRGLGGGDVRRTTRAGAWRRVTGAAAATCASVGRSPRDPRPRWWSRYGSRSSTLLQLPEPEQVGTFCCVESRESGGDDGLPPDLGICKSNLPLGSAAFTSSPHRRQAVEGRARCLAGAAKAAFSLQKNLATPKSCQWQISRPICLGPTILGGVYRTCL